MRVARTIAENEGTVAKALNHSDARGHKSVQARIYVTLVMLGAIVFALQHAASHLAVC
jgi:hypothetical protein